MRSTIAALIAGAMGAIMMVGLLVVFVVALEPQLWSRLTTPVVPSTAPVDTPVVIAESIPDVIERVNPAVVSVIATKDVPIYEQYFESVNPFGDWFPFGGFSVPRLRERGTEEREVGGGSGFLVSSDGHIVTNRHVVSDRNARYSILTASGDSYPVTVKAVDAILDIAILQLDTPPATPLPYLDFGDSDAVRLGETVIAIGNALAEFRNTVSVGIISGIGRSLEASDGRGDTELLTNVFQTDAAINPGNSGGPLLNLQGEVIAVNVAASIGAENIGFAIPAAAVEQIVSSVATYGEIRRPYLGVRYVTVTPALAAAEDLPREYGALVRGSGEEPAVMPDSPAAQAGLQAGDLIIAISDQSLENTDLARVLREQAIGETITLTVVRDGTEITLSATLATLPTPTQ